MPSDVLQALLGFIASGANAYTGQKETFRREKLASDEAAAERQSRKDLQEGEFKFRAGEGSATRTASKDELILKIQADRDNLQKQLDANLARAATSNSIEREKLALSRDELTSNIDRLDKELKFREKELATQARLKGRELDIEQGAKLGTGTLAGENANPLLSALPDLLKAYVSARGADIKPDEAIGFLRTVVNMDFVNRPPTPTGIGPPVPTGEPTISGVDRARTPARPIRDMVEPFINYYNVMNPPNNASSFPAPGLTGAGSAYPVGESSFPSIDIEALLQSVADSTSAKPKRIKTLK